MKNFFNLQRFVEEYYNPSPNQTMQGTPETEYFENSGSIVKIFTGGGNDTVKNTGNLVTIAASSGNNSIYSSGDNIKITAGKGDDTVYNYGGDNVKISVGNGNNSIYSPDSEYVTIIGGAGNDTINAGGNCKISVEGGDNHVDSSGSIVCGTGNDYVKSYSNSTVMSGNGNDTIYLKDASNAIVAAGNGDDYIGHYSWYSWKSENTSISAGAGNDTIESSGYFNYERVGYETLQGDTGDDYIQLYSYSFNTAIKYSYGDGNDTIFGFNGDDTLYITTPTKISTMPGGSDIYIKFDNGQVITLKDVDTGVGGVGRKNIVTISGGNSGGGTSTDTLPSGLTLKSTTLMASKNFKGKTIDLTKYSKVKTLNASAVTQALKITGNKLANTISGGKGKDTIYGGAGNDSILGNAGNDKLFGDAGNDTLSGGNDNDTLTGGKGNDVFVYTKGKDVITDYASGDKIKFSGTTIQNWTVKGKDIIFTTNQGSLTVKNGKDKEIDMVTKFSASSSAKTSSNLFAEENNFVTSDNLSEITKNILSPTALEKIETTDVKKLTVENDLITYSEK